MMYKGNLDQAMGTDIINRIIFDKVRKDMYQIASGTGARYNIFYTPKEVEDVAYTIGLLKLRPDQPETHMCKVALYVSNKDLDGMIGYYRRYIWSVSPTDIFKGILDGILMKQMANANDTQKAAIKDYFISRAQSLEKEAKGYRDLPGIINK